jgi:hypothetical protein
MSHNCGFAIIENEISGNTQTLFVFLGKLFFADPLLRCHLFKGFAGLLTLTEHSNYKK